MNKQYFIAGIAVLAAASLAAAPINRSTRSSSRSRAAAAAAAAASEEGEEGKEIAVRIEQYPKLGRQATLMAPSLGNQSTIGQAYTKPRSWIVLEAKYQTQARCIDQLTFEWHVLLETKSATSKDKEGQAKLAPYSYFSQTVTYVNIPRGTHAASVCLHPSYLEQYGEPKAVGLVVKDGNGKEIVGDAFSEIQGIKSHTKFWEDDKIMNAKTAGDQPMIERRQGLQDRSKTLWALVNPNDFELVLQ